MATEEGKPTEIAVSPGLVYLIELVTTLQRRMPDGEILRPQLCHQGLR
jgi:hypothetical protein